MKTENMRTLAIWLICGLTIALMIVVVIRGWPDAPTPAQAETEIAATSSVAEVQAETPAPTDNLSTPKLVETNQTNENLRQQMERLGFDPNSFHRVVVKEK